MNEKIKAGENVELDGIVIDNQTKLGESLEKKEEPTLAADKTPAAEAPIESEVPAEEPVNQETPEVPEVTADVPTSEEASTVPEIPIPIPDETSNDNTIPESSNGFEQTYQSSAFESYQAPIVNEPVYVPNEYNNSGFVAQTPNLLIDENVAIQNLTNEIYKEVIEPYKNTYSLLSQAVKLLEEIGRNGYVTGPNHDAIKGIIASFGFSQHQSVGEPTNQRTM